MSNRIFLIGGPARCGKTTLAKMVRREIDGQVMSGDALAKCLRECLDVDYMPALYVDKVDKPTLDGPHEIFIKRLRRRDKAMWQFFKSYIKEAHRISQDDILLDANLWADHISDLGLEHRAVFMVDTSDNRADWIRHIRDTAPANENNWMHERNYTDEKIEIWAKFDVTRAKVMIEYCKKYNYPYFDIAEHGISRAQELAKNYLLSSEPQSK